MLRSTVVCLGSIDWEFNWQIPQEIVSGLAGQGHRVLYIENTGVRRPGIRDLSRLGVRLRNWVRARGGITPIGDGIDIYAPVVLPFPYSRLARSFNCEVLLRTINRWIDGRREEPVIFLTFLATPLARALSKALSPTLVIYYCTDRLDESSPAARRLLGHERALLADADVVFTTSSGLLDSVSRISRRSVLLTSGVRFHEFRQPVSAASLPTALHRLGRPIVGYVGSLRNELNLPLLAQAARLAPDLTFVLVGPVVADVSALAACPNITLPGSVAHAEAIRYMRSFDVGVLPYRINAYTTNLLPVKLKEYLAAGLPIVSTGLPEVKRFVAEHGALVTFAETADAFVSALRATVASNSADDVERRVRVARHYDWSEQIASMTAVIETAFEETASGRVAVGSAV